MRADGKQLYGILDYRNVEASKELASKAQYSADHVEYMTQQMKQEAILMRIITLVTLFFLPGTFVSVSFPKWLKFAAPDVSPLDAHEHGYRSLAGPGIRRLGESGVSRCYKDLSRHHHTMYDPYIHRSLRVLSMDQMVREERNESTRCFGAAALELHQDFLSSRTNLTLFTDGFGSTD